MSQVIPAAVYVHLPASFQAFLAHPDLLRIAALPRNSDAEGYRYVLQDTGKRLRGITGTLRSVFHPLGPDSRSAHRLPRFVPDHAAWEFRRDTTGCANTEKACAHGQRVDTELQEYCNLRFAGAASRALEEAMGRWDACTHRVLDFFREHNLAPICSQILVFDETRGLATALDLVCFDYVKQKVVLIELKCTRYTQYLTRYAHMMQPPLDDVPDAVCNHHLLQLATQCAILKHKYDYVPDSAFVLQVHPSGVRAHALPKWLEGRGGEMYEALAAGPTRPRA